MGLEDEYSVPRAVLDTIYNPLDKLLYKKCDPLKSNLEIWSNRCDINSMMCTGAFYSEPAPYYYFILRRYL